jgi:hypothetical protein
MFPRWWRLGIRPQITIIVILGAIFSTVATLFIANSAITSYVQNQASTQEQENLKISQLVLETQFGQSVSIDSSNNMVADLPTAVTGGVIRQPEYGRYTLNDPKGNTGQTDYVDRVQRLIGGTVSVYQCADAQGNLLGNPTDPTSPCTRIETTLLGTAPPGQTAPRAVGGGLERDVNGTPISQAMNVSGGDSGVHEWLGKTAPINGVQYFADYSPIFNPDNRFIGVIFVGVPLDTVTSLVNRTAIELIIIGTIIMFAGIILALIFANSIVSTLQRAARQVSGASERIGGIAAQQASGSAQQVWAINAINQALQNFSETARDISQRTDQLALMGNQVLQRRQEISPTQIDSILAYITRSVRDISVASRQQAAQYERMTGAMQAVIEIAEQVAGNSQQSSESSERLDLVVRQLQQLVGVRLASRRLTTGDLGFASTPALGAPANSQRGARGVRPSPRRGGDSNALAPLGGGQNAGRMAVVYNGADGAMQQQPSQYAPGPQYAPGAQFAPQSAGLRQQAGRMAMAGGPPDGGYGANPAYGNAHGGPSGRDGSHAAPGYNQRGGMPPAGAPQGGYDVPDWRLPPMPEMPPLPGWGGPQMGQLPPAGQHNDSFAGGAQRANLPPRGRGFSGGLQGGASDPYASRENGNSGWPGNRGE